MYRCGPDNSLSRKIDPQPRREQFLGMTSPKTVADASVLYNRERDSHVPIRASQE